MKCPKPKSYRSLIQMLLLLVFGMISTDLHSQTKPSEQDFLLASAGMGIVVGYELFAKDQLLPSEPRFSNPNHLDLSLRNILYWGDRKQEQAKVWSDRLIYGVSFSSLVWGPLMAKDPERAALINMEVFSVNSMLTNLIKIAAARERPYHHFQTRPSLGSEDYTSFYSGHSSVAFSQAVTNAMILSQHYPEREDLIWSSLLTIAGVTAYLRVASDMHYFTDIIFGAGVGTLIAWSITSHELDRFDDESSASGANFTVSLKIPLG